MTLSDIAAGLSVTHEQRDRGVTTVDDTGPGLAERFRAHADALPCTPAAAATVVDSFRAGASVGDAGREAGVAPITAAKALHRCGVAGVCPLGPTAREVVRDWLAGELPRTEALELVGADDAEFALTTYVETHDPVPELADAVAGAAEPTVSASVAKRDALGGALDAPGTLR